VPARAHPARCIERWLHASSERSRWCR
jgi:hypothetical protein